MKPDMYPDFIESCKTIGEIGCLKPGEKVCIMGDRRIEADVIYALIATAKMFGCDPYVCMIDEFEEWMVPDTIAPAVLNANVVFHAWPAAAGAFGAKQPYGARWLSFGDLRTIEAFCSEGMRIPPALLSKIVSNTWAKIDRGAAVKKVHITDPKGTDFTLELSEAHMEYQRKDARWHGKLICDSPGTRAHLPLPHGPNIMTPSEAKNVTINGVVVYDSMTGFGGAYSGEFYGDSNYAKPVKVYLKNGEVMKVEGGWESRVLADMTAQGGQLAEIGLGFNPKVPSYGGRSTGLAGSSRSGSLHIATTGTTGEHVDGCLFRATVVINGETIVENGHLMTLDDPDIQAMAKEMWSGHEGGWLWEASENRELQNYR